MPLVRGQAKAVVVRSSKNYEVFSSTQGWQIARRSSERLACLWGMTSWGKLALIFSLALTGARGQEDDDDTTLQYPTAFDQDSVGNSGNESWVFFVLYKLISETSWIFEFLGRVLRNLLNDDGPLRRQHTQRTAKAYSQHSCTLHAYLRPPYFLAASTPMPITSVLLRIISYLYWC